MRIAIVGAGAVGQLFGALLTRAQREVVFVARGNALAAISRVGIAVDTPTGAFRTPALRASSDPADLGTCDAVIVAVKSWQVEELAPSLRPLLGPGAVAVSVQNGVEAADRIADALGPHHAAIGVCHVLATRTGEAEVRHGGPSPELAVGAFSGPSDRLEPLAAALRSAGIEATVRPDIRARLWQKLLFVEPLGSIGAATRAPVGVFRQVPETRALLERAMHEVGAVATARGIALAPDIVAETLARIDTMPEGAMTSMHRDLVEGRPSELYEQTGAVVRLGAGANVPRPVHEFLMATLLPRERENRRVP
jgi:2-dehydropantoate 2-reductase